MMVNPDMAIAINSRGRVSHELAHPGPLCISFSSKDLLGGYDKHVPNAVQRTL